MSCEINLKFNEKDYRFNSEAALDEFINNNLDDFIKASDKLVITSPNKVKNCTLFKLSDVDDNVKAMVDTIGPLRGNRVQENEFGKNDPSVSTEEKTFFIPTGVSATKLINLPLPGTFKEEDFSYETLGYGTIVKDLNNVNIRNKNDLYTNSVLFTGTLIHSIVEFAVENYLNLDLDDKKAVNNAYKALWAHLKRDSKMVNSINNLIKIDDVWEGTSYPLIESAWEQSLLFLKKLKEVFGEFEGDVELICGTTDVTDAFKDHLTTLPGYRNKNKNCIYGYIDLIVRVKKEEEDDEYHIFDFKTYSVESKSRIDPVYTNGNGRKYAAQLLVYSQILKKWGIHIDDKNIHPLEILVERESETTPVKAIFKLPENNSNFKSIVDVASDDIDKIHSVLDKWIKVESKSLSNPMTPASSGKRYRISDSGIDQMQEAFRSKNPVPRESTEYTGVEDGFGRMEINGTNHSLKINSGIGVTRLIDIPCRKVNGADWGLGGKIFNNERAVMGTLSEIEKRKLNGRIMVGDLVHDSIEYILKGKDLNELKPKYTAFDDDIVSGVWSKCNEIVDRLKSIHGHDAEFETEFAVISKKIGKSLSGMSTNTDCVYGYIDLLVKDKYGKYHVYDFKTHSSELNQFKERKYAAQLMTYSQILQQWGINIPNSNLHALTIKTSYDATGKLDGIQLSGLNNDGSFKSITDSLNYMNDLNFIRGKLGSWLPLTERASVGRLDNEVTNYVKKIFPPEITHVDLTKKESEEFKDLGVYRVRTDTEEYRLGYTRVIYVNRHLELDDFKRTGLGSVDENSNKWYLKENEWERAKEFYDRKTKENSSNLMKNLADDYKSIIGSNKTKNLDEFVREVAFDDVSRNWFSAQFAPYINNQWELISSDDLISDGIFILQKVEPDGNKIYDIVMMSQENLFKRFNFADPKDKTRKATTVAGAFFYDGIEIDEKTVLQAYYGNMLIMKAMAFITHNVSLFEFGQIRSIKALNLKYRQQMSANNKMILQSWDIIMSGAYRNGGFKFDSDGNKIFDESGKAVRERYEIRGVNNMNRHRKKLFMNDDHAYLDMAMEIINHAQNMYTKVTAFNDAIDDTLSEEQQIANQIHALIKTYEDKDTGEIANIADTSINETNMARHYVLKAYAAHKHRYLMWEEDIQAYKEEIKAPAMSGSANVRLVNNVIASYKDDIARDFNKTSRDYRKVLLACYKEAGVDSNAFTFNESKFFETYFIKDKKNMLMFTVDEMAAKYGENSNFTKLAKLMQYVSYGDGEFEYDNKIPLIKAGFLNRMQQQKFIDFIKDDITNIGILFKDAIDNDYDLPDMDVTFGTDSERQEKLDKYHEGYFSMNLDYVFQYATLQKIRRKWQKKYNPQIAALKASIIFMNAYEGKSYGRKNISESKLKHFDKWFDDYIKSTFYDKTLVSEPLIPFMRIIDKIAQFASGINLKMNTSLLFREIFTSTRITFTRAGVEEYAGINHKTVMAAWKRMIGFDEKANFDGELYQMNCYFRMANMDIANLADVYKTYRWNLFNINGNRMYITSSLGDLYFRNLLLKAKMIADGTADAYSLKEDGSYGYMFDKDERFKILKKDFNSLSIKEKQKYHEAMERYNMLVDFLNVKRQMFVEEGNGDDFPELKRMTLGQRDIQPLWDGYTDDEIQGIRNYADSKFGHYNEENKMMMHSRFLGHFLLQYRTVLSAQLEQAFNGSNATNIAHYRLMEDAAGERMYMVPLENGQVTIKSANQLTEAELRDDRIRPIGFIQGQSLTGTVTNLLNMGKVLIRFKKNPDEYKTWLENPVNKGLLYLFLLDNLVAALLLTLINFLYDTDSKLPKFQYMKEGSWVERWTYKVLAGTLQDGPILNIMGQLNTFDPPVLTQVINWYGGVCSVLTGRDNFMHVAMENIGMTREFSSYFDVDNFV